MKVVFNGSNNYLVKLSPKSTYKAIQSEDIVANKFVELSDVSIPGLSANNNNYPVVYNSTLDKFVIVNPDTILSAASTTTGPQPGLPDDFVNTLDNELDNKIDLDAGTF